MSGGRIFLIVAGLSLTICSASSADEMCAAKVQNNDQYQRAVDHLRIAPSDRPQTDENVTVNRIVLPGHDNITAIHWNCGSHDRSYTIIGMSTEGNAIVQGQTVPGTSDMQIEDQPLAELTTK